MRYFALLATIYAATLGTASALVDARRRTTVDVAANGWDERTSGHGCSPDGCIPENTRDKSRANNSRWSCKADLLEDDGEGCWIEYYFKEPQDIVEVRIAFYKGTQNTRKIKVYNNYDYYSTFESSGETNGYQTFYLDTDETAQLRFYLDDYENNRDVWLSMKEVKLMVE